MVTKLNKSNYKLFLWFSIITAIISGCTAEYCEYCYEGAFDPFYNISFTYTPKPVAIGDTVLIHVSYEDSTIKNTTYYWTSRSATDLNTGKFLDGTTDNDYNGISEKIWYLTNTNQMRWIFTESSQIRIRIRNDSLRGESSRTLFISNN